MTSLGQAGVDLVGPDASQGPDGIQDLHLRITGLAGGVEQIRVQAPGGFQWATAPDATGAALAEYFPSSTAGSGDLYLNPRIRSDLPSPGGSLPLGGSTGSLISLSNGITLTLTIDYQGQLNPALATVPVSGLVSATDPMPQTPVPGNVVDAFQVVDLGQDGTGQSYEQGFVHLVITAASGLSFDQSTFNHVVWELGDRAGLAWDSTAATVGHNHVYATLRSGSSRVVDLYFPPARDEASSGGADSANMTLLALVPGVSTVYSSDFAGGDWSVSARASALNSQPAPSPAPTTEAQLRALLASTSPEFDTINLPANTTIVMTQPLAITHSVAIIGNNATLLFQQGSTAAWPASASGAIYVNAPAYTNIRVTLSGFTIKFDLGAPIRWSNPSGAGPALFDPENNPAGISHAVIDTRDSNTNLNLTSLVLNNMHIEGPPAFDGASFAALSSQATQNVGNGVVYAGELAIDLVRTNDLDVGTISNSTFQGGSIELYGGPWTISGNTVSGSLARTYSAAAFALHSAHDVTITGNQVTQSDPSGHEFRLVALAVSGYGNVIQGNTFGGGAGSTGNEVTYSSASGAFGGINDPEVMLAESSYGVLFEGRPGAISADGRLLILPNVRAWAAAGSTGPGLIVSILGESGPAGASVASPAGSWYQVALQVSLNANNTIELLMEDALPPPPSNGYYIIEVTSGFVNNSFENNQINLAGKSSTGMVLNGADFGTRITGNVFVGGLSGSPVYSQTAISITSLILSDASGTGAFPLPLGWTALPDFGTVVQSNTIRNFVGGIVVGVQHFLNYWEAVVQSSSETGRVFVSAAVTGNVFAYDTAFLSAWSGAYGSFGNNPAETSLPPPVTVGSGWSAQAPGPYGSPRFPWTLGAVDTINGANSPIFVDPVENAVTVQTNTVETIGSNGAVTTETGSFGQVYAGVVNGTVMAPQTVQKSYQNQPYNSFNLMNLDVSGGSSALPPPPPPPPPPSAPPALAAPGGVVAGLAAGNQVGLSWNGSAGASHYIVERRTNGTSWAVVAPWVTTTSFLDTGLAFATTYSYCVAAVSSSGAIALGSVVSVTTGQQLDLLSVAVFPLHLKRRVLFAGPVASFTDTNTAATAAQFVATINWGDGRSSVAKVRGGAGSFVVSAAHVYAKNGNYGMSVIVTSHESARAIAQGSSAAAVTAILRPRARSRVIHRLLKSPTKGRRK